MNRILGLKIDVDTYQGMRRGVPRLLSLLRQEGLRATFFLSIGPDASGRAMLQILKNPSFLKKMVRTRAASLYGFRTALYGTLLPSPLIALSFPDLVCQIMAEGHEVQFHAWDHRRWQDELAVRPEAWIRDWFRQGIEGFESLTGKRPASFGAPAWLIDDRVLSLVRDLHLDYLSCTRAKEPFIHEGTDLVELPSDLPCFEETGLKEGERKILAGLAEGRNPRSPRPCGSRRRTDERKLRPSHSRREKAGLSSPAPVRYLSYSGSEKPDHQTLPPATPLGSIRSVCRLTRTILLMPVRNRAKKMVDRKVFS